MFAGHLLARLYLSHLQQLSHVDSAILQASRTRCQRLTPGQKTILKRCDVGDAQADMWDLNGGRRMGKCAALSLAC